MKKTGDLVTEVKNQGEPLKVTKQRTYFFQIALTILTLCFAILAILAKHDAYFPFDVVITRLIQEITIPGFEAVMIILTNLGNPEWVIVLLGAVVLFFATIGRNYTAVFFLLSVGGAEGLSVIFKTLISRPRPTPELIHQIGSYLVHDSFPSGHVLYYVGTFGFLEYLIFSQMKKSIYRTILLCLNSLLLIGIGFSRIYVGAHWFSDTLGAYLIGSAWLLIIIQIYHHYRRKYE